MLFQSVQHSLAGLPTSKPELIVGIRWECAYQGRARPFPCIQELFTDETEDAPGELLLTLFLGLQSFGLQLINHGFNIFLVIMTIAQIKQLQGGTKINIMKVYKFIYCTQIYDMHRIRVMNIINMPVVYNVLKFTFNTL